MITLVQTDYYMYETKFSLYYVINIYMYLHGQKAEYMLEMGKQK